MCVCWATAAQKNERFFAQILNTMRCSRWNADGVVNNYLERFIPESH